MKKGIVGLLVLAVVSLLTVPVHAVTISWTDWTSATAGSGAGSAYGTITMQDGTNIGVRYFGEVAFAQTSGGGINYWTEGTPAPYTGNAVVDNAPPDSDIVALNNGGSVNTLIFDAPVEDFVMALVSIGRSYLPVTYSFSQPFTLLSEGQGYWGDGTWTQNTPNELTGYEAHGVLQFSGQTSVVQWITSPGEYWHGFTVGVPNTTAVPEPSTMLLLGSGLLGLVGLNRRRKA